MSTLTRTCADSPAAHDAWCGICSAQAWSLRMRAAKARIPVGDRAIREGSALLAKGDPRAVVKARHLLRLADMRGAS